MARVAVISSNAQVEYRIEHLHGCGVDAAADYRIADMGGEVLVLGNLARELGFEPGQALSTDAHRDAVRAILNGVHPVTGAVIGEPVLRTHPDALLPAAPLVEAIRAKALGGVRVLAPLGPRVESVLSVDGLTWGSQNAAKSWERMVRGVTPKSQPDSDVLSMSHEASIVRLAKLAQQYDVDLPAVYGAERVRGAELAAAERVDVRVRGLDLTFELDKSISVTAALTPNRAEVEADLFGLAREFAEEIEVRYARGVVGHHGDGQARREVAGQGLLMTATVDPVSREGDAHWHVHLLVANLTRDESGQWRALSRGADDLHHNAAAEGEAFKSRARHMLAVKHGWKFEQRVISRTGQSAWRVADVSEYQVRATSTRQKHVEEYARSRFGVAWDQCSAEQQKLARDKTRPGKESAGHNAGLADLAGFTRASLSDAGLSAQIDPTVVPVAHEWAATRPNSWTPQSWQQQVEVAADAIARQATNTQATFRFSDARVHALASLPGVPAEAQDTLVAQALEDARVVSVERVAQQMGHPHPRWRGVYTTVDVIDAGQRMQQMLERGAAERRHTLTDGQVRAGASKFAEQTGHELSGQQYDAVRKVCTAGGAIVAVQGWAGTGKSTVMRAAALALQGAGVTVTGTSAAAVAKEVLAAKAGIRAETIASLIGIRNEIEVDREQRWAKVGDVLIVDEAGMADARDLAELAAECEARGKRMIAVGDLEQLPPVGIAGGFSAIISHGEQAGSISELTEVRRQRSEHEVQALTAWREHRYQDAMSVYAARGQVHVVDTHSEALELAAGLYRARADTIADPLARAEQVALIAARNADAATVANLARIGARDAGQLTGPDRRFSTPSGWLDLAVGELVLLKANQAVIDPGTGQVEHLRNGRRGEVEQITPSGDVHVRWHNDGQLQHGVITVADIKAGMVLPGYVDRGQLLHGAGATTHSTQGNDVEYAVVLGTGLVSPEIAYVALSRDRERTDLVLDIESQARTPEETNQLRNLPPSEREQAVMRRWVQDIAANGPAEQRSLIEIIKTAHEPTETRPTATRDEWAAHDVDMANTIDPDGHDAERPAAEAAPQPAEPMMQDADRLVLEVAIAAAGIPDSDQLLGRIVADPRKATELVEALRDLERTGHEPGLVISAALEHDIDSPTSATNPAAVLTWRVGNLDPDQLANAASREHDSTTGIDTGTGISTDLSGIDRGAATGPTTDPDQGYDIDPGIEYGY